MIKKRIEVLDSLRGIASLQVVISHVLSAIPFLFLVLFKHKNEEFLTKDFWYYIRNSPLHFMWNGSGAVIVFFVLSGFVLSLPYFGKSSNNYKIYFVKRLVRLYLPCFAIITLAIICADLFYSSAKLNSYSDWLHVIWSQPFTSEYLTKVYLLNAYYNNIDSVLWTLPIEIQLSLILPFFLYFFRKLNFAFSIATVLVYIIFYHSLVKFKVIELIPALSVLFYFTFFITGSLICKYKENFIGFFDGISSIQYWLLFCLAIVLYTTEYSLWWLPTNLSMILTKIPVDYYYWLSASLLMGFTLSKRFESFLSSTPLLWMGKISFSLYLTHMVVIALVACILPSAINAYIVIGIGLLVSFIFAPFYYKFIEVPSLNVAKKLSGYL
ncbi:MAG: acyltransferase [Opitutaceae bacterium]|nr:acyltransferase [Cytophagales bacterium]